MRERKYIKFRTDMYDDTKMKIIDTKPERDLIHYICTRLITLAGKVNSDGDLFMSRNIPYTLETLAIEFNRDIDQVKLALDVLMELEILELTEDNVYRVINFAKHQNIKVKGKVEINSKKETKENIKNEETQVKENLNSEIYDDENKVYENKIDEIEKTIKYQKKEAEEIVYIEDVINHDKDSLEITHENIKELDNNIIKDKSKAANVQRDNIPILLEAQKNKKGKKKKKNELNMDVIDEEPQDDGFITFYDDGIRHLGEGEQVVGEWTF